MISQLRLSMPLLPFVIILSIPELVALDSPLFYDLALAMKSFFPFELIVVNGVFSWCLFADYRTVSGVRGPLVILDNVKVSLQQNRIVRLAARDREFTRDPLLCRSPNTLKSLT